METGDVLLLLWIHWARPEALCEFLCYKKEWRNNGTLVWGLVKSSGWPAETSIKGGGRNEVGERTTDADQNGVEGRRWDE